MQPHLSTNLIGHPVRVLALSFTSALLALGWCHAAEAQTAAPTETSALQVMADITVIDSHCRGVTVYYDALFRYGEDHDIVSSSVMPLGSRRRAFEAAMAWRLANVSAGELCTDVIGRDDDAAPGVLKR